MYNSQPALPQIYSAENDQVRLQNYYKLQAEYFWHYLLELSNILNREVISTELGTLRGLLESKLYDQVLSSSVVPNFFSSIQHGCYSSAFVSFLCRNTNDKERLKLITNIPAIFKTLIISDDFSLVQKILNTFSPENKPKFLNELSRILECSLYDLLVKISAHIAPQDLLPDILTTHNILALLPKEEKTSWFNEAYIQYISNTVIAILGNDDIYPPNIKAKCLKMLGIDCLAKVAKTRSMSEKILSILPSDTWKFELIQNMQLAAVENRQVGLSRFSLFSYEEEQDQSQEEALLSCATVLVRTPQI